MWISTCAHIIFTNYAFPINSPWIRLWWNEIATLSKARPNVYFDTYWYVKSSYSIGKIWGITRIMLYGLCFLWIMVPSYMRLPPHWSWKCLDSLQHQQNCHGLAPAQWAQDVSFVDRKMKHGKILERQVKERGKWVAQVVSGLLALVKEKGVWGKKQRCFQCSNSVLRVFLYKIT